MLPRTCSYFDNSVWEYLSNNLSIETSQTYAYNQSLSCIQLLFN